MLLIFQIAVGIMLAPILLAIFLLLLPLIILGAIGLGLYYGIREHGLKDTLFIFDIVCIILFTIIHSILHLLKKTSADKSGSARLENRRKAS